MHPYKDWREGEALTPVTSGRLLGGGSISGRFFRKGREERNWLGQGHGQALESLQWEYKLRECLSCPGPMNSRKPPKIDLIHVHVDDSQIHVSIPNGVPKHIFTVQWNNKLSLSKTELIFSPYPHTNKLGPPLVFLPSLNGTTGHRVVEVKNLLVFLAISLCFSSSSWDQPPSQIHWTS